MRKLFQFEVFDEQYKNGKVPIMNGFVVAEQEDEAEYKVRLSFLDRNVAIKIKSMSCDFVADTKHSNLDVFLNSDLSYRA